MMFQKLHLHTRLDNHESNPHPPLITKELFDNKLFDKLTKDQKSLTTMMDNLYMDKLKGSITDSAYDRFYQKFREQLDEINDQLVRLQEAENNYYITTKYVLELSIRAHELFIGSEVEERRQLIKFLLSNLQLDGENIV